MSLLSAIVRFSLRHRGIVVALSLLLLAAGVQQLRQADYDVFPEFSSPQVSVETGAPGLAPEEVERLVTQPIENALVGVAGVESIRSESILGLSSITLRFDPKTNIYRDREQTSERLSEVAGELPAGVERPSLTPLESSTGDVMIVGLTSKTVGQVALRTVADWTVRPHLLAVPGVASVSVFGEGERTYAVQLLPDRLVRYGLSIQDVVAAATNGTGVSGAGFIDTTGQRLVLRAEGQARTPADLARTVIRWHNGEAVTLGDVAKVEETSLPSTSAALINGEPGVILKLSIQYGANTLAVTRGIDAALGNLGPALKERGVTLHANLFRAANFIEVALTNIRNSLLLGAGLVVLVLLVFLFDLRTALISCLAIPLSLLAAVIVLEHAGMTLNVMTIGGLAIAIGEVVDDAVIDVENILKRLRENRRLAAPKSVFQVVLDASLEVRGAIVYATFSVALVFMPVMTMSGLSGRLFAPLGEAYIVAVLSSLAVALTVTPALCLILLRNGESDKNDSPLAKWLHVRYGRLLSKVETKTAAILVGIAVMTVAAVAVLPWMSPSFLPAFQEGHLILHMTMAPGSSLEASAGLGRSISEALLKLPAVRSVGQKIGHATFDDVRGPEGSEFDIDLKPGADTDEATSEILIAVAAFPGASYSVNSFFVERVNETLSGFTTPVAVNLYGDRLDELGTAAAKTAAAMAALPGATGVQIQSAPGTPGFSVQLRWGEVRRWGLTPQEVLDAVQVAYGGRSVGEIHRGSASFPVTVILAPGPRSDVSSIGNLPLKAPDGRTLFLRQVADIRPVAGRYAIFHDGARRVEVITCDVRGRPVPEFVAAARRALEAPGVLPAGVVAEFGGSADAQATARNDLIATSLVALVGIVMLLGLALRRRTQVALVLLNAPFALVGGVIAALITGGDLSLGTMVGFITVFGISLRNSIMLVSHYGHLVEIEGRPWNADTALLGAQDRLVPILMTSLVTAFGLVPLALGRMAAGREIEGPMAVVILGGLVTSTLLNLIVMPSLALRFARFGHRTD